MDEQLIADINQLLKLQSVLQETKTHFEGREKGSWAELMATLVNMGIPLDVAELIGESVLKANFHMYRVQLAAKRTIGDL